MIGLKGLLSKAAAAAGQHLRRRRRTSPPHQHIIRFLSHLTSCRDCAARVSCCWLSDDSLPLVATCHLRLHAHKLAGWRQGRHCRRKLPHLRVSCLRREAAAVLPPTRTGATAASLLSNHTDQPRGQGCGNHLTLECVTGLHGRASQ